MKTVYRIKDLFLNLNNFSTFINNSLRKDLKNADR